MQRRGFSLIDYKMSKKHGTELRRIWDILGHLYNKERLRANCDVVRTTLCGRICKGNGVKNTLWERCCEKDISFDLHYFIDKYSCQRMFCLGWGLCISDAFVLMNPTFYERKSFILCFKRWVHWSIIKRMRLPVIENPPVVG